jgi:hypothetical protein
VDLYFRWRDRIPPYCIIAEILCMDQMPIREIRSGQQIEVEEMLAQLKSWASRSSF